MSLSSRSAPWLVAGATILAFVPALFNGFVNWDDMQNIVRNEAYRGFSPGHLKWMFTNFMLGHYQPVSWLTFALDFKMWGAQPFGYHLTNLLLHAANAVLFFFVSLRLLALAGAIPERRRFLAAAAAALLFSLHPLRVESVAWITERRDVLSAFFFLGAVLLHLKRAEVKSGRRSRNLLFGIWACGALAFFSKVTAVTLPVALLLLDAYPLRRLYRSVLVEKIPLFAFALIAGIIGLRAQTQTPVLVFVSDFGLSSRLAQVSFGLGFYPLKSLFPYGLLAWYDETYLAAFPGIFLLGLLAIPLTVILILSRRERPALLASWAWYLLTILPMLGLIKSSYQLTADRYSYIPCLGIALLAGAGAGLLAERWGRRATIALGAVFIGLGLLTMRQTRVWHDSRSLWEHAAAVSPGSVFIRNNLGVAAHDEGRYEEAIIHFSFAEGSGANDVYSVNVSTLIAIIHNDWAVELTENGGFEEALLHFREALRSAPEPWRTHRNIAVALGHLGRTEEAKIHLARAAALEPSP